VLSRRLDDRIRDLCAKAVEADQEELESIFAELKQALREHAERLRKLAVRKLVRTTSES
jgi:hypothetical protein